ncbi:hypothetical protein [Caminicella sporogenes]|uniref:hypothetical protein n=1 Tax=Caminicella sporogenes TaxID=166485 RepID=UPI0025406563|nr:hypothetical protein [Caminicella sporogenes]WIF94301.1 hypothetical protein QNI18_08390 [Caminicella sporogenes]
MKEIDEIKRLLNDFKKRNDVLIELNTKSRENIELIEKELKKLNVIVDKYCRNIRNDC